jgi:hypothetical protein
MKGILGLCAKIFFFDILQFQLGYLGGAASFAVTFRCPEGPNDDRLMMRRL